MEENIPTPSEDTITFKRSYFFSVLSVLTFGLGLLVGFFIWGYRATPKATANVVVDQPAAQGEIQQAVPTPTPRIVRYDIPTDGYPSLGPADAPIVLVEFSDYQCPFCQKWYQEVYGPLLEAYPDKIRLVYRNLPLTSIHPEAMPAALAAMCAGDQDAYFPYHDKLFSGQFELGRDAYVQYATDLGLDVPKFTACLEQNPYQDFIQTDMDFSTKLGVRSTPTFFVNGMAIVGAQPLEVFKMVIDRELAGEFSN
jgi:protein-disulfide isomerase